MRNASRDCSKLEIVLSCRGWRSVFVFRLLTIALFAAADPAKALESTSPYARGITIGVPIGALPPPGVYLSNFAIHYSFEIFDGAGRKTGSHIDQFAAGPQLLYVPDIPTFLGASYAASISQPFGYNFLTVPNARPSSQVGLANTVVQPILLSWRMSKQIFLGAGLAVYLRDGSYSVVNPASIARNYASIEPNIAFLYKSNPLVVSIHAVIDVNWTNPTTRYHSGMAILTDYSMITKFDKLSLGLGGTLTYQLTNDTVAGVPIRAVSGRNGFGNRAQDFTIGPVVSYDLMGVNVQFTLTQSLFTRNTAGGTSYFATLSVPLSSKGPSDVVPGPR